MLFGYAIDWEIVVPALVIGAPTLAISAPIYIKLRRSWRRRSLRHARRLLTPLAAPLYSERCQLLWDADPKDKKNLERWAKRRDELIAQHVSPHLDLDKIPPATLGEQLNALIDAHAQRAPLIEQKKMERMDPYEFEKLCATILFEQGWRTKLHGGSGDQGVDVEAIRRGKKLVVQCKKYSSPIGNKAVQEALGAKYHIKADFAAVVTNTSYTRGARELSASTGVHLLHYVDLYDINALLGV
jgi:restriction system protein